MGSGIWGEAARRRLRDRYQVRHVPGGVGFGFSAHILTHGTQSTQTSNVSTPILGRDRYRSASLLSNTPS